MKGVRSSRYLRKNNVFVILFFVSGLVMLWTFWKPRNVAPQISYKTPKKEDARKAEQMKGLVQIERFLDTPEQFTVVLETYKRMDIYLRVLHSYCNIDNVKELLLVWNNDINEHPPPSPSSFKCRAPVRVLPQAENQVQNRLLLGPLITTDAVLQVDDDVIISPDDVQLAFEMWRIYRDQIISFATRYHAYDEQGTAVYMRNPKIKYSIAIGQAMFIHKSYYTLYASDHPIMNQLREYVKTMRCCDDIAMNFIVASQNRKPPLYVRVSTSVIKTKDPNGHIGKYKEENWGDRRSAAVQEFIKIFGYNPLVYNDMVITKMNKLKW